MSADQVVHDLQAVPYLPVGRTMDGLDCWGQVLEACRRMGWPVPPDPMEAAASPSARAEIFARHLDPSAWQPSAPRDGAVAFSPSMARALHAGIMIAGGLLDTSQGQGARWTPLADLKLEDWEFAVWAGS
jgi:hypothetical protein